MSDFDREAERERLREKYEQDKKERETTEQMSELLLQGATMTNAHCSECGDPIFRYDGQEFCATCERPVDRESGASAGETPDTDVDEGGDDTTNVEVTSPRDDTKVVFGGNGASDPEGESGGETGETPRGQAEQPASADAEQPRGRATEQPRQTATGADERLETGGSPPRAHDPTGEGERSDTADPTVRRGDTGGVEAARASLVRTLAAFSRRAETTDDPQRAREHLQTAREAAEALAALRQ
jgi:uncharacterized Zn finger protein (UPF0148 family)